MENKTKQQKKGGKREDLQHVDRLLQIFIFFSPSKTGK
jgi:hypothetical protein